MGLRQGVDILTESFETKKYDVVVVGAGGAGLRAAIAAADYGSNVALVTKSLLGKAHTVMAEGGGGDRWIQADGLKLTQDLGGSEGKKGVMYPVDRRAPLVILGVDRGPGEPQASSPQRADSAIIGSSAWSTRLVQRNFRRVLSNGPSLKKCLWRRSPKRMRKAG